jgi:GT2 family glycosyltransferase
MIPIVLLHHNDYDFLYRTINSIKLNTIAPYKLIVVDNCSTKNDSFWLKIKQKFPGTHVIFNKKNNWVYGFNLAKPS